jgi:hypothetical protein
MPQIEKLATENLTIATFKVHSVKNEAQSKKEGRPIYDDMPVCELKFAANKQTVGVFPAHEVFRWHTDPSAGEREPLTYALAYPDQWRKFLSGEAQVASGTPLSELTFIAQGKRLELKALNIHTAESLAAVDGNALRQLGQGGRTLKEQAQAYLERSAGTADVSALAAENVELRERLAALEGRFSGSTAAAAYTDTGAGEADDQSPFFIMEADDIRNWLIETAGRTPPENLSHAGLVKLADEVNAALAAAKEAAGGAILAQPIEASSDDQLREFIKAASGRAAPHNAGRAALEARAAELVEKAAA